MVDALRLSTLQECAPLIFRILAQSLELRHRRNWMLDHVMDGAASENTDARLGAAREHLEKLRTLIDGDTAELVELESYLDRLERLCRIDDSDSIILI